MKPPFLFFVKFLCGKKKEENPPLEADNKILSSVLRNILLVNILPLVLLAGSLLYLNDFQNSLLETEVIRLREQAKLYAVSLSLGAVEDLSKMPHGKAKEKSNSLIDSKFVLNDKDAQSLLMKLTGEKSSVWAKLYSVDGSLLADSRNFLSACRQKNATQDLQQKNCVYNFDSAYTFPAQEDDDLYHNKKNSQYRNIIGRLYDKIMKIFPNSFSRRINDQIAHVYYRNLRFEDEDMRETPPYIRLTPYRHLIVTVVEPIRYNRHTIGIVQLSRHAIGMDEYLYKIRSSIFLLFLMTLTLTVLLSWYLAQTIAKPLLKLAFVAQEMTRSRGRTGSLPYWLVQRKDGVGILARSLQDMVGVLRARMDAIERFAADVSHEIKNPLSSIKSAIETILKVSDIEEKYKLLTIMNEDVKRLDRLLHDISDASRVDAELSRAELEPVNVSQLLATLVELYESTRKADAPRLIFSDKMQKKEDSVIVMATEGRLVQVIRNLISNAVSFSSPKRGKITLLTRRISSNRVYIAVEDEGPGIPENDREKIFERFYSERPVKEDFGQHSGLGLSISKQIIEALGGRIYAENRKDKDGKIKGARFVIILPNVS